MCLLQLQKLLLLVAVEVTLILEEPLVEAGQVLLCMLQVLRLLELLQ
jgi:hypothetical protein